MPDWISPMLATLTNERFSDKNWMFERKLDGERCLAYKDGESVHLLTRNKKELNIAYPEIVDALKSQGIERFILDGEVVAFTGEVTDFAKLQDRMHVSSPEEAVKSGVEVFYYLFDILYLDGYDLLKLDLRSRKGILEKAVSYDGPLRYLAHRNEEGEEYYNEACEAGWEGLIAKYASGPYVSGRSADWLKFKCVNEQEFVIGGYTEPKGKRILIGALLVGYYGGEGLVYAGKVGTGFNTESLQYLYGLFQPLKRETSPFVPDADLPRRKVHWLEPELVAQIGFSEWTRYGKLRQPRYLGLRRDKAAKDVVREDKR